MKAKNKIFSTKIHQSLRKMFFIENQLGEPQGADFKRTIMNKIKRYKSFKEDRRRQLFEMKEDKNKFLSQRGCNYMAE